MLSPLSRLLHSETAFEDRFACPGCSRCGTRSGRWPRRYHNIEMPPEKPERTINAEVLSPYLSWRSAMSKFGIIGATALSLTLAVAGPALSLIHISEPTRLGMISYAVFCLKKKN